MLWLLAPAPAPVKAATAEEKHNEEDQEDRGHRFAGAAMFMPAHDGCGGGVLVSGCAVSSGWGPIERGRAPGG